MIHGEIRRYSPNHLKAVWVDLSVAYPPPQPHRETPDGIDFRGNASGWLAGWWRTGDGLWLGVVTFDVGYYDGRRHRITFRDQLIPASALSTRNPKTHP